MVVISSPGVVFVEVVDEPEVVGDDDDAEEPSPAFHSAKRQHDDLEPIAVTPTLEAELTVLGGSPLPCL